jgi:Recombinase
MDRQEIIAKMNQMRTAGMSYQAIADSLNADGIQTFSGKGIWSKGTIAKLITKTDKQEGKQDKHQGSKEVTPDKQEDKHREGRALSSDEFQRLTDEIAVMKQMIAEIPEKIVEAVMAEINIGKQELVNIIRAELSQAITDVLRINIGKQNGKQEDKQVLPDMSGQPDLFDGKQDKQKGKQTDKQIIGKWNIQCSGGYHRAFRKHQGKQIGVYLGRIFDRDKARKKLMEYEQKHGWEVSV